MKALLVWLVLCSVVSAGDITLKNVSLLTTYSESGYPVEAQIFSSFSPVTAKGDLWTVSFADEKVRKTFFDIINNHNSDNEIYAYERNKNPSRITVDITGEESLSLFQWHINIKSLSKTLKTNK